MNAITGIGKSYVPMMLSALAAECDGLRVGLEGNIFLEKGDFATKAQLVARADGFRKTAGRDIATAVEERQILKLKRYQ